MNLVITPLGKQHDRKTFDCGEASLNLYLTRYANQDIRRRVNRVFVASPPTEPKRVIGYYSLSAGSLAAADLPKKVRHRLPRYPVKVVFRFGRENLKAWGNGVARCVRARQLASIPRSIATAVARRRPWTPSLR